MVEFLQRAVEGREGIEIDVFDHVKLLVVRGSSPRVEVRGPITRTEETVNDVPLIEYKHRTLIVQAPEHDTPIAPLQIYVRSTSMTSQDGVSGRTFSHSASPTMQLYPEMRDQMLIEGLRSIGVLPK